MPMYIILAFLCLIAGPVALAIAIANMRRIGALKAELRHAWATASDRPSAEPNTLTPPASTSTTPPTPEPVVKTPPVAAATAALPVPPPTPQPATPRPAPRPTAPSASGKASGPKRHGKPARSRDWDFESILGGQWLTWVGILALFFGTAFFLGIDLGQHALAGLPQVLIGVAVAAVFSLAGRHWSSGRERVLGLGLLGGGVALSYLAAYAAYGFHQLVPLWVVFPLLLIVATAGALLALERNSLTIASLTLVGAFLTPVVLRGGDNPTYALLPYLVAVNLGAMLVGLRRGWAGLPMTAFLATLMMVVDWWLRFYQPTLRGFAFVSVAAIWLIYAVAPWVGRIRDRFWSLARALVLAAAGLAFGLFCYHLLAPDLEHLRGLALALLALVYLGMSRYMQRRRGGDEATRLTHFTGVALLAIAVPVQLDLAWVTFGWTALGALLLYAGLHERDVWQRLSGAVVLGIGLLRSTFLDLPHPKSLDFAPLVNGEFLAGLALAAVLGWLFWAYHRHVDRLSPIERSLRSPILILAVLVLAWRLTLELIGYFSLREVLLGIDQKMPRLLYLVLLWAVYGFATSLAGIRFTFAPLRFTGYAVLGGSLLVTAMSSLTLGVSLTPDYRPIFNLALVQGVLLSSFLGALFWIMRRGPDRFGQRERLLETPLLVSAVLMVVWKLSLELLSFLGLHSALLGPHPGPTRVLYVSLLWAIYGFAGILAGLRLRLSPLRLTSSGVLGLSVLATIMITTTSGVHLVWDYRPIFNLPFLQGVITALILGALFWIFTQKRDLLAPNEQRARTPLLLVAILLLFTKISLEVVAYFQTQAVLDHAVNLRVKSLLTLSLFWAAYGGAVVGVGFATRFKPLRILGVCLLGLTVLKVFLMDMQALDKGYRIAAFVGLGILLLAVSLLYQKQRRDAAPTEAD